jgi:hypothetical protein
VSLWTPHPHAPELQVINPVSMPLGVLLAALMLVGAVVLEHASPAVLLLVPAASVASFFLWMPSALRPPAAVVFVALLVAVVKVAS